MGTPRIHSAVRYWFRWDFQSCGETNYYLDHSICCIVTCLAYWSVGCKECLSSWDSLIDYLLHASFMICWFRSSRSCLPSQLVLLWFDVSPRTWYTHSDTTLSHPILKIKIGCSSYVCPGSSCHTYGQNVNTETQCLYYINFYYKGYCLYTEDYRLSHRAAAEQSNPHRQSVGAMHAPRRNLHCSSSSHLCLLSSITARVSRLMVATQQV
jgi:hypothetical protein